MNLQIRTEVASDYSTVENIIKAAFEKVAYSDQSEYLLVPRLRKSDAFIPDLSLVAELDGKLVGHILLTRIQIKDGNESYPSLALAPVSVHPNNQGKGIGGKLIKESHKIAKALGFKSIVLLGHADYYPRFGYELCADHQIRLPFEVPKENAMVIALSPDGLKGVKGEVQYDPAFFA